MSRRAGSRVDFGAGSGGVLQGQAGREQTNWPRAVQVAIGCGAQSTGSRISPITEGDGIISA